MAACPLLDSWGPWGCAHDLSCFVPNSASEGGVYRVYSFILHLYRPSVYPVYPSRKGCFSPYTGQEVQCIQGGKHRYIATPLLWLPWACPCKATCKAPRSTPLNLVGQNKSCTIAEHNSAAFKELYKMTQCLLLKIAYRATLRCVTVLALR